MVPQHDEPALGDDRRGGAADRLRRRGLLPRRAEDPRPLAAAGPAAVLPHRLVHESARPVGDSAALLGALRRGANRPPAVGTLPARGGRRPQPAAARHDRARPRAAQRARGAARAPRLLRGRELSRRARRRGARRPRRDRPCARHARRLHGRSRGAAGRAGPLVQDVVPRGLGARPADRARPRARPAQDRRAGLAARRRPHARRARRGARRGRRLRGREPRRRARGKGAGPGRGLRRVSRRRRDALRR